MKPTCLIYRNKAGKRFYCVKAVGSEHYIPIAEILTDSKEPLGVEVGCPKGRTLICENTTSWVVTLPGDHDGDKVAWVRCSNRAYAERMLEHVE